jgi:sugar phosphate isomerase/epimerase
MKFGIQTGLLPGDSLKEKFANAKRYGFEGIEAWGGDLKGRLDEHLQASEAVGLPISSMCLGFEGCLLSPRPEERRKALDGIVELLKLGEPINPAEGCHLVVPPIFGPPQINDLSPYKSAIELEYDLLILLLKEIAGKVEGSKSILLLEPLNRYEQHLLRRMPDTKRVVDAVGSPNVQAMFDFFHFNIEAPDIGREIEESFDCIRHFHLASSHRQEPGTGHIAYEKYLPVVKRLGFKGYLVLECGLSGPAEEVLPKSLQYLRRCAGQ